MPLSYERLCAEIPAQTDLLAALLTEADPRLPVPTCPAWTLNQLVRHVGGVHRWAETIVRTRAAEPVPDDLVNEVAPYADEDPAFLSSWLTEGASSLVTALRETGPEARVWTPQPGEESPEFWARHTLHETAVHRADAALAVGAPYDLSPPIAEDAIERWLTAATTPEAYGPELLGRDVTLQLLSEEGEGWRMDLLADRPRWTRASTDDPATTTVRGPLPDLMLFLYGRPTEQLEVEGDRALLRQWRDRAAFWLD
ncbi:maleylpyruvate isomerase family mycothiol-dependent enzyme [Streptomyces sp. ODS28]|uniref:maleylpyruvate isomerase family mycothiol-dependent enzyme n=1 Tax=Streptomyces sp. ODS28 TaxID=3136688 RepID=UPI0031ED0419